MAIARLKLEEEQETAVPTATLKPLDKEQAAEDDHVLVVVQTTAIEVF